MEEPGGLPVTTASPVAFDHYARAVDSMLAGRAETAVHVAAALEADEAMPMAWLLQALLDRLAARFEESRAALARAVDLATAGSDRERSALRFFTAFQQPDRFAAEQAALTHLRAHPCDRLVVQQVHYLYNLFLPTADRRQRHQALAAELAPAWADDWYLLAERAFIATEAGDHVAARDLAERSLATRPENAPAAHSLAHALLESGAPEGRAWLGGWLRDWGAGSTNACHLTWHHALLVLADGESRGAVERLEDILSFNGRTVSALTDGASLMWRLELEGWSEPLPWHALEATQTIPGFAFGNVHRALVLAGLRRPGDIRELAAGLDPIPADACLALADYVDGEWAAAADRLLDRDAELVVIGGSRAQLEVLEDTMIAALDRSGRRDEASSRLARRLASRESRRDRRWLAALS